jgi:hypothetical protein
MRDTKKTTLLRRLCCMLPGHFVLLAFCAALAGITIGKARAADFEVPSPESMLIDRIAFTLKTSANEFVFFHVGSDNRQLRFSRVDQRSGALLDQPLLEMPVSDGSYNRTRALALRDGGFAIAVSFPNFFFQTQTKLLRFDANGNFLRFGRATSDDLIDFFEAADGEVVVFRSQQYGGENFAERISLRPEPLPSVVISSAQICPAPNTRCRWIAASRDTPRTRAAPPEMPVLRIRGVSFEQEQVALLRVSAEGSIIGTVDLGLQPVNTNLRLRQFDAGVLLSSTRERATFFRFYDMLGQLTWAFERADSLFLRQISADPLGLSVYEIGNDVSAIVRIDASGTVLWTAQGSDFWGGEVVFDADGSVGVQRLLQPSVPRWQWIRRDGRLLALPANVQSFNFTGDGGAFAVAAAPNDAKNSKRFLRLGPRAEQITEQAFPTSAVPASRLRLLPSATGLDLAYFEDSTLQIERYNSAGLAAGSFQVPNAANEYRSFFDSVDRSFVLTAENTLLALGPMGVRLWEKDALALGLEPNSVLPLEGGVMVISVGDPRANIRILDVDGEITDNLDLTTSFGSDFQCKAVDPMLSNGDVSACIFRAGFGAPLVMYRVDRQLRIVQSTVIFSTEQITNVTDDGGVILASNIGYRRLNRFGQRMWEIPIANAQFLTLIPTRSGGAWAWNSQEKPNLSYIDANGVIHQSNLSLGAAPLRTLVDDSLLLSSANKITRVRFASGNFDTSERAIPADRTFAGALQAKQLRSAWIEKQTNRREYFIRLFDWPPLPADTEKMAPSQTRTP